MRPYGLQPASPPCQSGNLIPTNHFESYCTHHTPTAGSTHSVWGLRSWHSRVSLTLGYWLATGSVLPFGPPRAWNVKVKVAQLRLTLCDPKDYTIHGILQARILDWVAVPFSRGSSQPRDRTQPPALQVDSFPAEPQGKPKNTGVGSLSLGSPAMQAESLPTELWGNPIIFQNCIENHFGNTTVLWEEG